MQSAIATALVTSMISFCAMAAPQNEKHAGLFGVDLGSRLALPECPEDAFDAPDSAYKNGLCAKGEDLKDESSVHHVEVRFSDNALPDFRAANISGMSLDVTVSDGSVQDVFLSTDGVESQQEVLRILTRKFGRPYRSGIKVMSNMMGARFRTIQAVWIVGTDIVSLRGASDAVDSGSIEAMTLTEAKRQDEDRVAAAKKKPQL